MDNKPDALMSKALPDLDVELAAIATMDWPSLRRRWAEVTGRPTPRVKHALLRMALAFELQASAYGGLSRRSAERLAKLSEVLPKRSRTTTVVREWKGMLHTAVIAEDGTVNYDGKQWRSLSEVARAITGTRWSGPAFFGLKQRQAKAA